jgi:LPXTG-site transpeptidase (sortase) family protein
MDNQQKIRRFLTRLRQHHRRLIQVGLGVVVLCFIFARGSSWYNLSLLKSEVKPASIEVPEILALPELDSAIRQFGLVIDEINIKAPIVADVDGNDKTAYNKALTKGVAHYKGTAKPGEGSNIFIFGHSSTVTGQGDYAKIFASLNDLEKGDEAIVYYEQKELRYGVANKQIVASDDLSVLEPTKKEQLTLMTCWPIGSNFKRLIVILKPKP